jgi:hypothetical protein
MQASGLMRSARTAGGSTAVSEPGCHEVIGEHGGHCEYKQQQDAPVRAAAPRPGPEPERDRRQGRGHAGTGWRSAVAGVVLGDQGLRVGAGGFGDGARQAEIRASACAASAGIGGIPAATPWTTPVKGSSSSGADKPTRRAGDLEGLVRHGQEVTDGDAVGRQGRLRAGFIGQVLTITHFPAEGPRRSGNSLAARSAGAPGGIWHGKPPCRIGPDR